MIKLPPNQQHVLRFSHCGGSALAAPIFEGKYRPKNLVCEAISESHVFLYCRTLFFKATRQKLPNNVEMDAGRWTETPV